MFGNTGAKPPKDAGDHPVGSVSAADDGQDPLSAANSATVGRWLELLPERSWDETPDD